MTALTGSAVNFGGPWKQGQVAVFVTGDRHIKEGKQSARISRWNELFLHPDVGQFARDNRDEIRWEVVCTGSKENLVPDHRDKRMKELLLMLKERDDNSVWVLTPDARVVKIFDQKIPSTKDFLNTLNKVVDDNKRVKLLKKYSKKKS